MPDLHQNHIIVPIGKTGGNVAVICKRIYALILIKELGVNIGNNSNNKTYEMINTTNKKGIIDQHTRFLKRHRLCVIRQMLT